MRPIPARHILAVAQAGVFISLTLMGQADIDTMLAKRDMARTSRPPVAPEPGTVVVILPLNFPPPIPVTTQVAFGLNSPAVVAGFLPALLLGRLTGNEADILVTLSYAIFVLTFWYLIGRRLDRWRGLLPPRTATTPPRFAPPLAIVGIILSTLIAFLAFFGFFWGHHGRNYMNLFLGMWLAGAAYVLGIKLVRWRTLL